MGLRLMKEEGEAMAQRKLPIGIAVLILGFSCSRALAQDTATAAFVNRMGDTTRQSVAETVVQTVSETGVQVNCLGSWMTGRKYRDPLRFDAELSASEALHACITRWH